MSDIASLTRSVRAVRFRARVPRAVAALLALVLIVAGVRATFAPTPKAAAVRTTAVATDDPGAAAFAEGFARAYLSWDAKRPDDRTQRLAPYVGALDADAGLKPGAETSQGVLWTSVVGERREEQARLVTVAVQTTRRLVYLSVPVSRDARGFLAITSYPAIVGPPATNPKARAPEEDEVEDAGLVDVVTRAMRNYLAGNRQNLLADLTPDALVSPPGEPLQVADTNERVTWVVPSRRVAVELDARDASDSVWTLRYELDVSKRERWYVHSVQVDPTFREGR
jgi:Conjugative transposon protein TcpC